MDQIDENVVDDKTADQNLPENEPTPENDPGSDDDKSEKLYDQEAANKAFIREKQKLRKIEEEKEKLAKEKAELEEKLAKATVGSRPEIPPAPDPMDEDYEKRLKERDDAIIAANEYDRTQKDREAAILKAKQDEQKKAQETVQTMLDAHNQRTKDAGIALKDQLNNENVVGAYVQDPGVRNYLLSNDQSPLLIAYLAENPMELEKVSKLDTANAAVFLATDVLPKVGKVKPKQPGAPDPLETIDGKAKDVQDEAYKGIEGATFE